MIQGHDDAFMDQMKIQDSLSSLGPTNPSLLEQFVYVVHTEICLCSS